MLIIGLSGSLRARSSNKAALEAVGHLLAPAVEFILYDGLASLPHFNPDLDGDSPPAEVVALRSLMGRCQAAIISCPEYAHGVPGSFKNALDWLVASVEFPGKPVMLIDPSGRAHHALTALQEILVTMSARLVPSRPVVLPLAGRNLDSLGIAGDPEYATLLSAGIKDLIAAAQSS